MGEGASSLVLSGRTAKHLRGATTASAEKAAEGPLVFGHFMTVQTKLSALSIY